MGATYFVDVAADTTITTTTETVVATLTGVQSALRGQAVNLEGDVVLTTGTSTTGVTLRVREDGLTGNLVDESTVDTAVGTAPTTDPYRILAQHTPTGELSNKSYVLTVTQVGAAANGTAVHANLKATLSP